jgi:hypothetical protein
LKCRKSEGRDRRCTAGFRTVTRRCDYGHTQAARLGAIVFPATIPREERLGELQQLRSGALNQGWREHFERAAGSKARLQPNEVEAGRARGEKTSSSSTMWNA